MMADFMGDDVGLREIARCAEAFVQGLEEVEVEIDFLVAGAITILRQSRRYSDCGPLKGGLSQSMKFKTTVPAGNSRNIDCRKNPPIHQRAG